MEILVGADRVLSNTQIIDRSGSRNQVLFIWSPAPKPAGSTADTHTLDPDLPNFERLLASAVIYGPNAAGKTNLLKGLQFMQSVVVNSSAISPVAPVTYAPFKFDISDTQCTQQLRGRFHSGRNTVRIQLFAGCRARVS